MKRNLPHMATQTYDVLIVGGGIIGACIAWDAALRGLKVALVEKRDFAHATSSAPSKLIHGGLRYLKNLEFGLVRESLRERRIMETIAPHQVIPLPFLIPAYGWTNTKGFPMLASAMILYEGLSFDKQWLADEAKKLPGFKAFTRKKILELEPGLPANGLTGGFMYYDCQMLSPERLALDFILSAAERGADVANYAEVTGFLCSQQQMSGVKVRDITTQQDYEIHSKVTINASGPWADILLGLLQAEPEKKLIRSKGIHIITRNFIHDRAFALNTSGGRHLFLIPWRNHTLIGTTDKEYQGHPDHFKVTETDIAELVAEVNEVYPAAQLSREDVCYFYGGLRPLVEEETEVKTESYNVSRKYEIYDHAEGGLAGFMTVIGGKFTTARHLAEQVVNQVYPKLGLKIAPCETARTPVWGQSNLRNHTELVAQAIRMHPLLPEPLLKHLSQSYGYRLQQVLELANSAELTQRIWEQEPDIMAQVLYGIRAEMAFTLSDIIFRRTGLGTLGHPGEVVLEKVAALMAQELNWSSEQKQAEIEAVLAHFKPLAE